MNSETKNYLQHEEGGNDIPAKRLVIEKASSTVGSKKRNFNQFNNCENKLQGEISNKKSFKHPMATKKRKCAQVLSKLH